MVSTAQFGLPLLMAAQAQKHITVNEALAKLDAFAQLRLSSVRLDQPPQTPKAGQSYFVAGESGGAWAGRGGTIATFVNGGWAFTRPLVGWEAWDEEDGTRKVFNGIEWVSGSLTMAPSGAGMMFRTEEFDHNLAPGTSNATLYKLPEAAVVFGISGRVISSVAGEGLDSWRLGVHGAEDRYGSKLGTETNSYVLGLTGTPMAYYERTPLLLSAEQGSFVSGLIRFSVHFLSLSVPRAV